MDTMTMMIVGFFCFIFVYLIVRLPQKVSRVLGTSVVRLTVGLLLLFLFNVFGGYIGLHVPINLFTLGVTTVLGLFGMMSLVAIHLFIL